MNNLNFHIKDLRVLRDIERYLDFYNRAMNIKNVFNFNHRVIVDVIDSLEELSEILEVKVPKWVIGTSFENVILILDHEKWKKSNNESVENLILHEFVHVVLNLKAQSPLPIWLNEGLAVYLSDQYANYKKKKPNINEDFDFYNVNYNNEKLYHISIYIIIKLIDKYSINKVIDETLKTKDFKQSKMFSNESLLELL
ncbi:TPA: hypothetical protein PTV44_001892 [Clostridium botulinum]|nr:hypothetical protein [Clostridium botulinum]